MSLLAKSMGKGDKTPITLVRHSQDVMAAFVALFGRTDNPSYFGKKWLRFFRLGEQAHAAFYANGLIACALHDIGKANSSFQDALKHRGEQFVRHEHLSAFLLNDSVLSEWLASIPAVDTGVLISAVLGHHLKASEDSFNGDIIKGGESMQVQSDHEDYLQLLKMVADSMQVALPQNLHACHSQNTRGLWNEDGVYDATEALRKLGERVDAKCVQDKHYWRLLLAVKAALIVADSVGSGVVRDGSFVTDWIQERVCADKKITSEYIEENVIAHRIAQIEEKNPSNKPPDEFQKDAGKMASRALMLAPCGSGKTLAAWIWICAQLKKHTTSRVIFLYPTRGTAGEGFKDYVSHAPETDAALLTSTARYQMRYEYEMTGMSQNPAGDDDKDYERNIDENLFKLGYWQKRIFSATAHQFLAFIQQDYNSLCLLPLLADSVVVIDEVHSFDNKMFNALKRFLTEFDVPVLCMTASLPEAKRKELVEGVGLALYPQPDKPQEYERLEEAANLPRYKVEYRVDADAADDIKEMVRESVNKGKKILWVVNTVNECQAIARDLYDDSPQLICYHSRFKYAHRAEQHKSIITAFQSDNAALGITTQVCEMSLDIDADILITQVAPITSLIQRMGRCNRHAKSSDKVGQVIIYATEKLLPYDKEDIATACEFINELLREDKAISQRRLETLLPKFTKRDSTGKGWEAFFEDKFWSFPHGSIMEDSEYTVQSIFGEDAETYKSLKARQDPDADGLILPCPKHLLLPKDGYVKLPSYLHIAPKARYAWCDNATGQPPRLGLLDKDESVGREAGIL